ncbi:MAG: sulfate reduction electron transfer complex DsrMKJOP subunit DsrM [Thermodesulfovibrionales bacterium]
MRTTLPLFAVLALVLVPVVGTMANMQFLFGVIIPYVAFTIFVLGFVAKVVKWGRSPVPFCIPTTCGQEESLPWIKQNKLENPSTTLQVIGRMFLEIFFFRSLFRNLKTDFREGPKIAYGSDKWLWMAGLAFHYSFLFILIRHARFFFSQVPFPIVMIEAMDSFFQIGAPLFYITDAVILGAVTFLLLRRVYIPQVRYISLAADFFPLYLILAIATSGVIMRYFLKTNIVGVKELAMGMVTLAPKVPEGVGTIFYVHIFLISVLFMYFPFSKLMHLGGVFLSPTRNMANNSRKVRHVNPWNYPVHVHTYDEYEEEFREKMKKAGIPVEKE